MRRLIMMSETEIETYFRSLGRSLLGVMPLSSFGEEPCDHVVIVFDQPRLKHFQDEPDVCRFISSVDDEVLVTVLREIADQVESRSQSNGETDEQEED